MPRQWITKRCLFLAIIFFALSAKGLVSADINGNVTDPSGEKIPATLIIYEANAQIGTIHTLDGGFDFELPSGEYILVVYSDDNKTEGFDYLPAAIDVNGGFEGEVSLGQAATLRLRGDVQYIDTENIPIKTLTRVQEQNGDLIVSKGFPLEFSTRNIPVYHIPGLDEKEVIIPADSLIGVNLSSSIVIDTEITQRRFHIERLETPAQGGLVSLDVRYYTIPINREIAQGTLDQLEERLMEMQEYGFYLARQEAALGRGVEQLQDSDLLYQSGDYDDSFGSLKRGYLTISHTYTELVNMYFDARFSVYLLVAFLSLASIITGYLVFDELYLQLITDTGILGLCLVFFYYTYPGSRTIPLSNFVLASAGFLIGFIFLGALVPRFFRQSSSIDGRVHTRNLIAPIFNLARRSLRRRKVRFLLTFISITLLVMSFVTLTSFSEGFGLITGRNNPKNGWKGVYIRDRAWTETEPSFILTENAEYTWIAGQPEVELLTVQAESMPLTYPLFSIQENGIYGVVGIQENEGIFIDLEDTLVSGDLPSGNGVLISESLAEEIGLSPDDVFTIGITEYTISGVFSDEAMQGLKDLDGTRYTPERWVNLNPDGEVPNFVLEETDPDEMIIMDLEAALRVPMVGVQRIAFKVNPSFNETDFAERLALERGYLTWANTNDAYISYRLGNYFQGKGATLVIPWVIVVLNVVVTVLNSLYERRKEIEILSSVGLNPAQVSSIFVAEAAITGFIAGGLGYLVGLGFYKALAILNIGLQVHQKVSAIWSFAAIGLAISAVVTGALAAIQNSVVITPSLMRRWRIDRTSGTFQEPWRIDIPIKLDPGEIDVYLDYVEMQLEKLVNHHTHITSSIKRGEEGETHLLSFIYKAVQTTTGNFYTRNTLKVVPVEGDEYGAYLESLGEREWVHVAGSLVRRITMDYSTERARG